MSIPGQTVREAILRNTLLQISGGQPGIPGAPGPPGTPSVALPHTTVTGNVTANVAIPMILANGTLTITLPPATGSGSNFWIKNIGTGIVTIDSGAGNNIDGAQTAVLRSQYEAVQLLDRAIHSWEVF